MINIRKNSKGNDVVFQMNKFGTVNVFSDASVKRDRELTFFQFEGGPSFKIGRTAKFGKMTWRIDGIQEHKLGYHEANLNSIQLEVTPVY